MAEETTKMQHPTLTDVAQEVPTDYVPAWQAQGWVLADEKPARKAREAPAKAADAQPDPKPRRTGKRASRRS